MKKLKIFTEIACLYFVLVGCVAPLAAQGYGGALTFQGLDHVTLHSAGSRAMAGISIGIRNDPGLMFHNPAALHLIQGMQVSLGGLYFSTDSEQEQHYAPVRYYPNLSLILEGLTVHIPDPDTTLVGFSAQDTVQRPYDDIGPNWSHSKNRTAPVQALLAVPISLGTMKIVAGIGAVEYANMNHYYQNNNVLSPSILSQRPLPTMRPTDDNPLEVDWFQSLRSREGSMQGYGISLAASLEKYHLAFGFSGMVLDGSSDDYEAQVARGRLVFFSNAFRADSVNRRITISGTSDFSGQEYTLSSMLTGRYVSIGFSVKPPTTITRAYNMLVTTDTTGTPISSSLHGEDKLKLAWRGTVGLSLAPRENLIFGLEYEFRPYESVQFTDAQGTETSPWLPASLFRAGADFRITPWLALRAGMRGDAEIFQPEGNYINDEPTKFTVYSAGIGVFYSGLCLNVTYENSLIKYQDVWSTAISRNSERRHAFVAQLTWEIPWVHLQGGL